MNGAESLLRTLVGSGVEVCFGNPGTSEMHFVAALDRVEGMRVVLGLFEGAVTGMADGYGRMAEKPAATLVHLGQGLANGMANLHNARRAATPIVNIVGDHATYHAQYDAPLASDVHGFARPVSGWVHSSASAKTVAADGARAVQAALQYPGQIATLILPADPAWLEADRPAPALPKPTPVVVSGAATDQVAAALRSGRKTMMLIRGAALKERGLNAAGRVAAATGARIACDTFAPRCQRGGGRVQVERIPYFAEQIVEFMHETERLILVRGSPRAPRLPARTGRLSVSTATAGRCIRRRRCGRRHGSRSTSPRWFSPTAPTQSSISSSRGSEPSIPDPRPSRCSICTILNLIGSSLRPAWAWRQAAQRRLRNSRPSSQAQ